MKSPVWSEQVTGLQIPPAALTRLCRWEKSWITVEVVAGVSAACLTLWASFSAGGEEATGQGSLRAAEGKGACAGCQGQRLLLATRQCALEGVNLCFARKMRYL